jgi:hypothetical protein
MSISEGRLTCVAHIWNIPVLTDVDTFLPLVYWFGERVFFFFFCPHPNPKIEMRFCSVYEWEPEQIMAPGVEVVQCLIDHLIQDLQLGDTKLSR